MRCCTIRIIMLGWVGKAAAWAIIAWHFKVQNKLVPTENKIVGHLRHCSLIKNLLIDRYS